jgi:hypothetical protein
LSLASDSASTTAQGFHGNVQATTRHGAIHVQGNPCGRNVLQSGSASVLGGGERTTPSLSPHLDTQLVVPMPGVSEPARVEAFVSFTAQTRIGERP